MSCFRRLRLVAVISAIAAMVVLGWFTLAQMPVQAQSRATAAITLDGRRLFEVNEAGQFSAENRAADANLILREAVRSSEPVKVEILQTNQLPVILVNSRHLLTVTRQDTPPGRTTQEQAEIWVQRITEAVRQGQEERRLSYFWRAILLAVLFVLGAIALHLALGWVWRYWLRRLLPQEANHPDTGAQPKGIELFLQLTLVLVRAFLWIGTAIYITDLFPLTREWSQRAVSILWMSLTSPVISIGESSYSVINIIILIGLFVGVLAIAGAVTNLVRSRVLRITNISRGVQESIAVAINYSLIFIGTVVLLQIWGLDITSLAIVASVLGVAIGFGLQGVAKELVSGFVVTFERAIEVGDFVEIGKYMGTVERLNARSTHIRTLDDIVVIVPNSRLLDTEVVNWSHRGSTSRLVLPVRVAYGASISVVRSALLEAARESSDVLKKPAPLVWFQGYGEDFLNFQLLVWISKPRKQFQIKSDLYFKIDEILRQQNINIPYPQRSLHLRSGSLPLELSPQLENSLSHLSEGLIAWLKTQLQTHNSNGFTNQSSQSTKTSTDKNTSD
ncbi:MAG: mechanosensitive ion channel [Chlorogloeopsis fritschii C42_A2020_084]|uniref:mechanosensitive ion channel family protein n=1 Tax=Chlorogloeopsis fritschii TaxID=1124 RepID=UPI001A0E5779|nr:mechanosensitive ion channel domain-containing protein [Chlorogloeopsis fritschii]MBF2005743.1 mechanosensitive ion channel [Chlorogloeopsis fritschii C42_A2020_084]